MATKADTSVIYEKQKFHFYFKQAKDFILTIMYYRKVMDFF